jgi:hypothetical protein
MAADGCGRVVQRQHRVGKGWIGGKDAVCYCSAHLFMRRTLKNIRIQLQVHKDGVCNNRVCHVCQLVWPYFYPYS